ncbi:MAG TPA: c-type cytochrome [Bdellovibrionota bacterium]|nr:c-type cytochrome [Bdellovibrionota bacterium]
MTTQKRNRRDRSLSRVPLIMLLALLGNGCVSDSNTGSLLDSSADAFRGGALYDKWWSVPDVKEGIEPGGTATVDDEIFTSSLDATNSLYITNAEGNTRTGTDTWRCKECHGWDYKGVDGAYGSGSHKTGFKGIFDARGKSVDELFEIIRDGKGVGTGHAFSTVLSDTDVADLVKFVRGGATDLDNLVAPDKSALGDAAAGQALFDDSCANSACHGSDGKGLNFVAGQYDSEYVFNIAHENPWETVHKIRFGQPDGEMPNGSVKGYTLTNVADILAYAQSLAPQGLEVASAPRGGVLWDTWWEENGSPEPGSATSSQPADNPLYATHTGTSTRTGSQTWRCKECHGWDYKGADGAYGSGSHNTNFIGVMDAAGWTAQELIDMIGAGIRKSDGAVVDGHAFEGTDLLDSDDVEDLALFIQEELVDDSDYISYVTKRSKGSATAGEALFSGNCAICHGSSGLRINFAHGDAAPATEYIGDLSRDNPYEVTHKIRFGQPGSDEEAEEMEEELGIVSGHMPSKFDAEYSEDDVADIVAYVQTLPGSVERGGQAWDTWWEVDEVAEAIEPGGTSTASDGTVTSSSLPATSPLYLTETGASTRTGSQTWRCKECHGWDYKGAAGQYAAGSHSTGFNGLLGVPLNSTAKAGSVLYDAIFSGAIQGGTNANHAFGSVLGDSVTRDLVNFIQDMTDLDATIIPAAGSELIGQVLFNSNCAGCHGMDGKTINFAEGDGAQEYVGTIAADNPWEFVNKVLHGQPGSSPRMPNAAGKFYSASDVEDLLDYAEELPQ